MITRRRYMGKKGLLPHGYTQVEYIENISNAYINTGVKPTSTMDCEFTFSLTVLPTATSFICGSQQYASSPNNAYVFMNANTSMQEFRYRVNSVNILNTNIKLDYNIHNIKVRTQKGLYIFDYQEFPLYDTFRYNERITNLYLFALHDDGKLAYNSKMKIYKFSATDGIPVRDYVPCINPKNVVGMYDTVEGKFYSSPNGVSFVAGPVV